MTNFPIDCKPLAMRELQLHESTDADSMKNVRVELFAPQSQGVDMGYLCPYRIIGIGSGEMMFGAGADAMDALFWAMAQIGVDLYSSAEAKGGRLTWCGDKNVGFPIFSADQLPMGATLGKAMFF